MFSFQCYPVSNIGKLINFGLGTVRNQRVKESQPTRATNVVIGSVSLSTNISEFLVDFFSSTFSFLWEPGECFLNPKVELSKFALCLVQSHYCLSNSCSMLCSAFKTKLRSRYHEAAASNF